MVCQKESYENREKGGVGGRDVTVLKGLVRESFPYKTTFDKA